MERRARGPATGNISACTAGQAGWRDRRSSHTGWGNQNADQMGRAASRRLSAPYRVLPVPMRQLDAFEHAHDAIAQTLRTRTRCPAWTILSMHSLCHGLRVPVLEAGNSCRACTDGHMSHGQRDTGRLHLARRHEEESDLGHAVRLIRPRARWAHGAAEGRKLCASFRMNWPQRCASAMACRAMESEGTGGPAAQMTPDELSSSAMASPDFQNGRSTRVLSRGRAALSDTAREPAGHTRSAVSRCVAAGRRMPGSPAESAARAVAKVLAVRRSRPATANSRPSRRRSGAPIASLCSFH